jgi:glycine/D-amino acid oxidase-like deaminating enzyme
MNPTEVRWPDSLWAAVTPQGPELPQLAGTAEADVIVIGAGFTGLSAALHLREAGIDVAVIEAAEPGWGASGRNNGQVIPTLSRPDPDEIVTRHGAAGERFVAMLRDSATTLFDLARRYQIQAELEQSGWIQPVHSPGSHQNRRAPCAAVVGAWRTHRVAVARAGARHARLGSLVWRLLESQRWSRQSAGAGARHGAGRAGSRRTHLCALAGARL